MCNLAGYIGEKQAAPILLEMLKRQEGLDAGFYTGIATIHEGKIYYAKVIGDTQTLIDSKQVQNFPGTVGFIHSRTPSGGDVAWGHPFVHIDGDDVPHAYIANGASGRFKNNNDRYTAIAQELSDEGYVLTSKNKSCTEYHVLKDGDGVHMSDAMCELIARNLDRGAKDIPTAMADAFCEMPGEIVGLFLSLTAPDSISYSRINMPMFVGFAEDGAYLASSPTAFDEGVSYPELLPVCSSGTVYKDRFVAIPYKNAPVEVAPITNELMSEMYRGVYEALSKKEMSYQDLLANVIKPRLKGDACYQIAAITYKILYDIDKKNRLKIRTERHSVDGVCDGFEAPIFMLSVKSF